MRRAIKLNFGDAGYYRVEYDAATEAALAKAIETMEPADRVNLLADNWALVETGRIQVDRYFTLADAVGSDRNRAVWEQVMGTIARLDDSSAACPAGPRFKPMRDRACVRPSTGSDGIVRRASLKTIRPARQIDRRAGWAG